MKTSQRIAAAIALAALPAAAGTVASYDVGDYVQRGLVLHLDGIRNAGASAAHDDYATTWADLAGGKTATIKHDKTDASAWLADGYRFGGGSYAEFNEKLSGITNTVTIQVVCDTSHAALQATAASGVNWPMLIGCDSDDKLNVYYVLKSNAFTLTFKSKDSGNNVDLPKQTWAGRYATAIRNGAAKSIFQTATSSGATTVNGNATHIADNLTVYVGSAGSTLSARQQRYFTGTIKAVRVYDRVLSDAELAQNRAIDDARFFGAGVTVATIVDGVEGNEACGDYNLAVGGHTFTAPQTRTLGTAAYACAGHTLETWNEAASAWGSAAVSPELSCTVADTSKKVRLTWQWSATAGAASGSIASYDAGDYVQRGLVLHLDGIRNAGASAAHDDSATTWADLAGGKTATIFHDLTDASAWRSDGYRFGGASYAKLNDALSGITNTVTIQVVCDTSHDTLVDARTAYYASGVNWPMLVGANDNDQMNIYYILKDDNWTLCFKNANGGNAYIGKQLWAGRYATAIRNGSYKALFQTSDGSGATAVTGTQSDIANNLTVYVGSAGSTLTLRQQRWFTGTIKSVRIYDRVLSAAELKANRAIDDARFFGAGVTVATSMEGLDGNEPCGDYALGLGGRTFTAPQTRTVGGDLYACIGYTLETFDEATSEWGAATVSDALSCTVADTSKKYRLTWQWIAQSPVARYAYLEADGNDWIDLEVQARDGTRMFADMEWVALSGYPVFCGTRMATANPDPTRISLYGANDGWHNYGYYTYTCDGKDENGLGANKVAPVVGTRYRVTTELDAGSQWMTVDKLDNGEWVRDCRYASTYPGPVTNSISLYLFTQHQATGPASACYCSARVHSLKIWQTDANGEYRLVRYLVPAKKSDGTAALWDRVDERWFVNGGTGDLGHDEEKPWVSGLVISIW